MPDPQQAPFPMQDPAEFASATGMTLAQYIRAKHPGAYQGVSDQELEAAAIAKKPQEYGKFPRTQSTLSKVTAPLTTAPEFVRKGAAELGTAVSRGMAPGLEAAGFGGTTVGNRSTVSFTDGKMTAEPMGVESPLMRPKGKLDETLTQLGLGGDRTLQRSSALTPPPQGPAGRRRTALAQTLDESGPGMMIRGGAELLNPFDVLTTAATVGTNLPERLALKGATTAASALSKGQKAVKVAAGGASAVQTTRGLGHLAEAAQEGSGEKAVQGGLETLAGAGGWSASGGKLISAKRAAQTAADAIRAAKSSEEIASHLETLTPSAWDNTIRDALHAPPGGSGLPETFADLLPPGALPDDIPRLPLAATDAERHAERIAPLSARISDPSRLLEAAPDAIPMGPGNRTFPPRANLGPGLEPVQDLSGAARPVEQAAAQAPSPATFAAPDPMAQTLTQLGMPPEGQLAERIPSPTAAAVEAESTLAPAGAPSTPDMIAPPTALDTPPGPPTGPPPTPVASPRRPASARPISSTPMITPIRNSKGKIKEVAVGDYTVRLAPGERISKQELGDLLQEQGDLLSKAKRTSLPKDRVNEINRIGLDYRRTREERLRLDAAIHAGAEVPPQSREQLMQAEREIGKQHITLVRKLLADAAKGESGQSTAAATIMLGRVAGMIVGGSTGYMYGDDDEARIGNAILGTAGGFALTSIPSVATALLKSSNKSRLIKHTAEDYIYASMLSRPSTLLKAGIGGTSGTVHAIQIRLLQGRVKDARAILEDLVTAAPGRFMKALANPSASFERGTGRQIPGGLMGLPMRIIAASDHAITPAMMKGGFSLEDAQRLTLAGPPKTESGQAFVRAMQKNWLFRVAVPFPKVATQIIEQGFSPFSTTITPKGSERIARGALHVAAGFGAYEIGSNMDPRLQPFLPALGGPLALPVAMGLAIRYAQEKAHPTQDPETGEMIEPQAIDTAWNAAKDVESQFNPFVEGSLLDFPQRLVPGAVSDAARLSDPALYGRDRRKAGQQQKTPSPALRARIPGNLQIGGVKIGRQSMPERRMPQDIFGDELPHQQIPSTWAGRLLLGDVPTNKQPSKYPESSPAAMELRRLGITQETPSGTITRMGQELPVPENVRIQLSQARGHALDQALSTLVQIPAYQNLPPESQRILINRVRQLAGSAMGTNADLLSTVVAQMITEAGGGQAEPEAGAR